MKNPYLSFGEQVLQAKGTTAQQDVFGRALGDPGVPLLRGLMRQCSRPDLHPAILQHRALKHQTLHEGFETLFN